MKKPPLRVLAGGTPVGSIARSDVEPDTFLFSYGDAPRREDAVSLTMPPRVDPYASMAGLLPVFEMNLPEGALRERLRLQFAKAIPEFGDLDLLQIVGGSQIGRLRYSPHGTLDENVPMQNLDELLTYRGSADLFAHLLERFAQHSGIAGMQPKVLLRDVAAPDKGTHRGATHIVKSFDPKEYPELAANEFICMRGAAAAGIATAHVRLSDNRQLLLVDRFDLAADGTYLGMEDFCVLDARRSHGRYDGSYEDIARRIGDYVSPHALGRAKEQFALTVAYACTVGNGDAHRKNFSVLYRDAEDEVSLAPAYDIVSTLPYLPRDTLALQLGGTKAFPDRDRLLKFLRQVTGMTRKEAARLLEQVIAGVNAALQEAAEFGRRHPEAAAFTYRLSAALHTGLERISG